MKPDVISQYCVHNTYPIFKRNLKKYRNKIGKIILYPSRHHGFRDFEGFEKSTLKETWVDPVEIDFGKEDWRQAETIPCLNHVESDWIWFSEQDFFVEDWDKFYADVERLMGEADMFGWWVGTAFEGGFLHPSCIFMKRELLERTNKDFRAHPEIDGCDHFAMLTRDAERLGAKIVKLQDIGYKNWENAFHLGGMTYPYQDFKEEETIFGVGNLGAFFAYNYYSRLADVEQHPDYLDLSFRIEAILSRLIPNFGIELEKWKKFYYEK